MYFEINFVCLSNFKLDLEKQIFTTVSNFWICCMWVGVYTSENQLELQQFSWKTLLRERERLKIECGLSFAVDNSNLFSGERAMTLVYTG